MRGVTNSYPTRQRHLRQHVGHREMAWLLLVFRTFSADSFLEFPATNDECGREQAMLWVLSRTYQPSAHDGQHSSRRPFHGDRFRCVACLPHRHVVPERNYVVDCIRSCVFPAMHRAAEHSAHPHSPLLSGVNGGIFRTPPSVLETCT